MLTYGDQLILGNKTFNGNTTINNLVVTGTQTIVNTTQFNVSSPYILLNLTGGANDGGIFFVTGSGLTGLNDPGPIIGFDHSNKFKFGISTRNSDLSPLDDIASVQNIIAYSGVADSKFATITNLIATGNTLQTEINNLNNYVVFTTGNQTISDEKTFNNNLTFNSGITFYRTLLNTQDVDINLLTQPFTNTRISIGPETGILGESINSLYGKREIKIWETGGLSTAFSDGPFVRIGASGVLISEKIESKVGIGTLFPTEKVHISGGNLKVEGDAIASNLIYNTGNQNVSGVKNFYSRPTVNNTGVLLSGEAVATPSIFEYSVSYQSPNSGMYYLPTGYRNAIIRVISFNPTGDINLILSSGNQRVGDQITIDFTRINDMPQEFIKISGYELDTTNIPESMVIDPDLSETVYYKNSVSYIYTNRLYGAARKTWEKIDANSPTISYLKNNNIFVSTTGNQTVSGVKDFSSRPTVNGTGVLLSGEAAGLPTTIVYTTGNQTISGNKSFINNIEVQGTGIFNDLDLSNISEFQLSGANINLIDGNVYVSGGWIYISGNPVSTGIGGGSFNVTGENIVYTSGIQYISGLKIFGNQNSYSGNNIVLAGGTNNMISGNRSIIVGGNSNSGVGNDTFIGGGQYNSVDGNYSIIVGGTRNYTSGLSSIIVGGEVNTGIGLRSFIGGGYKNYASGEGASIFGGEQNISTDYRSTVVGGFLNQSTASYASVFGGNSNCATGQSSLVLGGLCNRSLDAYASVLGGQCNTAAKPYSLVAGGICNSGLETSSIVVGGRENIAAGFRTFVGGGNNNINYGQASFIGGGSSNYINGVIPGPIPIPVCWSFIGGGQNNNIGSFGSFIGAGASNAIVSNAYNSFIGGGSNNTINASSSIILGGDSNTASSSCTNILGGQNNYIVNAPYGIILGGYSNIVGTGAGLSNESVILGGSSNAIYGRLDITVGQPVGYGINQLIGNGSNNQSMGCHSVILNGKNNRMIGRQSSIINGSGNAIGPILTGSLTSSSSFNLINFSNNSIINGIVNHIQSGNYNSIINGENHTISGNYNTAIGGKLISILNNHSGSIVISDAEDRIHRSYSSNSLTLDFSSGVYFSDKKVFGMTPEIINVNSNFNISGNYNSRMILAANSSQITGTLISGNPTGFNASIIQIGAGQIQITGLGIGVSINSYNNQYKTAGQFASISLLHTGNNGYIMYGNTSL